MIIEGNVIIANDGKSLTNGDTYSKKVYLGIYDSPSNWTEINDEDVPSDDPATEADFEAALARLGVET